MSWQDTGRTSSRHLTYVSVPGYFFLIQDKPWGTLPVDLLGPRLRAFVIATAVALEPHGAGTIMAAASGMSWLIVIIASTGMQMFGAAARRGGGSERSDGCSPSRCHQLCQLGSHTPPPALPTAESPLRLLVVPVTFHPYILYSLGNEGCVLWASPWCAPSHILGL